MSEPEQFVAAVSPAQRHWLAEMWAGYRPRFIATGIELMSSVALLLSLAIFYLFLGLLVFAHVPLESVKNLERIDFWFIYAVFVASGLLFVAESFIGAYVQIGDRIKSTKDKINAT
jgi:hypothetical protein